MLADLSFRIFLLKNAIVKMASIVEISCPGNVPNSRSGEMAQSVKALAELARRPGQ